MTSQLSFCDGDYVEIDPESRSGRRDSEGGKGFIEALHPTLDVRYVISGLLSPSVDSSRIHTAKISTSGRRKGVDGGRTPSILDYSYPEYRRQQLLIAESTSTNITAPVAFNCCCVVLVPDCELNTRILLSYSITKNSMW